MLDQRSLIDPHLSCELGNVVPLNAISARPVTQDELAWHQKICGKGICTLLDSRGDPSAADMRYSPGTSSVKQNMAKLMSDRESLTEGVRIEKMLGIDDDCRTEIWSGESDPADCIRFKMLLDDLDA